MNSAPPSRSEESEAPSQLAAPKPKRWLKGKSLSNESLIFGAFAGISLSLILLPVPVPPGILILPTHQGQTIEPSISLSDPLTLEQRRVGEILRTLRGPQSAEFKDHQLEHLQKKLHAELSQLDPSSLLVLLRIQEERWFRLLLEGKKRNHHRWMLGLASETWLSKLYSPDEIRELQELGGEFWHYCSQLSGGEAFSLDEDELRSWYRAQNHYLLFHHLEASPLLSESDLKRSNAAHLRILAARLHQGDYEAISGLLTISRRQGEIDSHFPSSLNLAQLYLTQGNALGSRDAIRAQLDHSNQFQLPSRNLLAWVGQLLDANDSEP